MKAATTTKKPSSAKTIAQAPENKLSKLAGLVEKNLPSESDLNAIKLFEEATSGFLNTFSLTTSFKLNFYQYESASILSEEMKESLMKIDTPLDQFQQLRKMLKITGASLAETLETEKVEFLYREFNKYREKISNFLSYVFDPETGKYDGYIPLEEGTPSPKDMLEILVSNKENFMNEVEVLNSALNILNMNVTSSKSLKKKLQEVSSSVLEEEGLKEKAEIVVSFIDKKFCIRNLLTTIGSPTSNCKIPFYEGFFSSVTNKSKNRYKNTDWVDDYIHNLKTNSPYITKLCENVEVVLASSVASKFNTAVHLMPYLPAISTFAKVKHVKSFVDDLIRDISVDDLADTVELVISSTQRGTSWSITQQTNLITAIIATDGNLVLPSLQVAPVFSLVINYSGQTYTKTVSLLADGRQRCNALVSCLKGVIPAIINEDKQAVYYDELPDEVKSTILNYVFRIENYGLTTTDFYNLPKIVAEFKEETGTFEIKEYPTEEEASSIIKSAELTSKLIFLASNTTWTKPSKAQVTMALASDRLRVMILEMVEKFRSKGSYLVSILKDNTLEEENVGSERIKRMLSHVYFSNLVAVFLDFYLADTSCSEKFKAYYSDNEFQIQGITSTNALLELLELSEMVKITKCLVAVLCMMESLSQEYLARLKKTASKKKSDFPLSIPCSLSKGNKDRTYRFNLNLVAAMAYSVFSEDDEGLLVDSKELLQFLIGDDSVEDAYDTFVSLLNDKLVKISSSSQNSTLEKKIKETKFQNALDVIKNPSLKNSRFKAGDFKELFNELFSQKAK